VATSRAQRWRTWQQARSPGDLTAAPPQHASQLRHCRACGSKGLERFSSRIFSQIDRATSRGMFTAMMLTLTLFALPEYNVLGSKGTLRARNFISARFFPVLIIKKRPGFVLSGRLNDILFVLLSIILLKKVIIVPNNNFCTDFRYKIAIRRGIRSL
jgi:hypothetical protein